MKTRLLKKFRKKADKRVSIIVCERNGVTGSEVRWSNNRATFFPPSQYEEANSLFITKQHIVIVSERDRYIRDNAYWLMVHHSDGFD